MCYMLWKKKKKTTLWFDEPAFYSHKRATCPTAVNVKGLLVILPVTRRANLPAQTQDNELGPRSEQWLCEAGSCIFMMA